MQTKKISDDTSEMSKVQNGALCYAKLTEFITICHQWQH
jgi:hypothetical protein